MRRLDTLLGVPAVYLLKTIHWLLRLGHRPTPSPQNVRNVLVVKCFGMGSVLLARPLLAQIRQNFPNAKISFLTFDSNRGLVDLLPEIDQAYYLSTEGMLAFGRSTLASLHALNRAHVDLSFDLEFFSKFTSFCALAVAAPWRVGFYLEADWRQNVYTHSAYLNSFHHVTLVFLSQLAYALAPPEQVNLELPITDPDVLARQVPPLDSSVADEERAAQVLERFEAKRVIGINPNAGELSSMRKWPRDRYAELIDQILQEDAEAAVVVLGGSADCDYVRPLVDRFGENGRVVNACGTLTIAQLMPLLKRLSLVISNDSGPVHMAALMGTDTISIFGPETPRLYRPVGVGSHQVLYRGIYCSPCLNVYNDKTTACTDNICVKGIGVAEVLERYREWLAERNTL